MHRYLKLVPLLFAAVLLTWGGITPAFSAGKIGVVLMHGKTGTAKSRAPIGPLIAKLKGAGILVVAPDMPWSRSRYLAKDYEESMAEIAAAVVQLKREGATVIVVGGHSMGANAALGYGARHEGVAGIMAIAPGHSPELGGFQSAVNNDYRRAKAMVDKGQGNKVASFADTNQGKKSKVHVKARVYLSWFDPRGPAVMPKNAAALKPGTALLWVVGKQDPMVRRGRAYAFDKAPTNPKSAYVEVGGSHLKTPTIAASKIVQWLKSL